MIHSAFYRTYEEDDYVPSTGAGTVANAYNTPAKTHETSIRRVFLNQMAVKVIPMIGNDSNGFIQMGMLDYNTTVT